MSNDKIAYVCGPLTELSNEQRERTKRFYEAIADVCKEVTGKRAFVPHEHCDPIKHANFSSSQVDRIERYQICECTSCLIVVAIAPSWGGGIEVEMANISKVPVIVMSEYPKKISRLLLGNPAVRESFCYRDEKTALVLLETILKNILVGLLT